MASFGAVSEFAVAETSAVLTVALTASAWTEVDLLPRLSMGRSVYLTADVQAWNSLLLRPTAGARAQLTVDSLVQTNLLIRATGGVSTYLPVTSGWIESDLLIRATAGTRVVLVNNQTVVFPFGVPGEGAVSEFAVEEGLPITFTFGFAEQYKSNAMPLRVSAGKSEFLPVDIQTINENRLEADSRHRKLKVLAIAN